MNVDRLITIFASIVVPVALAIVGHVLGAKRTKAESAANAPADHGKTVIGLLDEIGHAAAPKSRAKWLPWAAAAVLVASGALTGAIVSRALASGASSSSTPAAPAGASGEVFIDRGEYFVRKGTADGLPVGASVTLTEPDDSDAVAKGVVVEGWNNLSRLRLDGDVKPSLPLVARFNSGLSVAGREADPRSRTAPEDPGAASLSGRARLDGIGMVGRIQLTNLGSQRWTSCDLRLPNNKHYRLSSLAAGDSESILVAKFLADGAERDAPLTWIKVTCAEGSANLSL